MTIEESNTGLPIDFGDVILIVNVFAIAILLSVLYIEQIVTGWNRVTRALNPLHAFARLKTWLVTHKVPH